METSRRGTYPAVTVDTNGANQGREGGNLRDSEAHSVGDLKSSKIFKRRYEEVESEGVVMLRVAIAQIVSCSECVVVVEADTVLHEGKETIIYF